MVTGDDADAGVAVDDPGVASSNGDVGEQPHDQSSTDCRAFHRGDDRLGAVDRVVDQVARLTPDGGPVLEAADDVVDHVEVTAGRERPAFTAHDDDIDLGVLVDGQPDVGELPVHPTVGRVEPPRLAKDDL